MEKIKLSHLKIHALPGFLGKASDWDLFVQTSPYPVQTHELTHFGAPSKNFGLWQWAEKFNEEIKKRASGPQILMGYSLGARLAMHALLSFSTGEQHLWKAAIFIAGHPGGLDPQESDRRKIEDEKWADRFTVDPWDVVWDAWNGQSLFQGTASIERQEKDYTRKNLSDMLRFWSLSRQEPLLDRLASLKIPILWVIGNRDIRYINLAQKISLMNTLFEIAIIPDAGHRVPWDAPASLQQKVVQFLNRSLA